MLHTVETTVVYRHTIEEVATVCPTDAHRRRSGSKYRLRAGVAGCASNESQRRYSQQEEPVLSLENLLSHLHESIDRRKVVLCTNEVDEPRVCGEDAFVNVTQHFATSKTACVAVLDGVGGWKRRIPDAGMVSHLLSKEIAREFEVHAKDEHLTPLSLMESAYTKLKKNVGEDVAGSTTACVALIKETSRGLVAEVANLGDSGLFVVRNGRVVFNAPKTAVWTVPRQLAIIPQRLHEEGDVMSLPGEAAQRSFILKEGDWVFVVSDGVLDNMEVENGFAAGFFPQRSGYDCDVRFRLRDLLKILPSNPDAQEVAFKLVEGCTHPDVPKEDDTTAIALHVELIT